jgi:PHD/YefM family antitoxin component YafN of YafNO toxin-antitoxin module
MRTLKTIGVREFREDLAEYLHSKEPVAVTKHGRTVGIFIPTDEKRVEVALEEFKEAVSKVDELLERYQISEEEVMEEFEHRRKAKLAKR